jgi:putative PIN family toxin of toxin-antitoxin system
MKVVMDCNILVMCLSSKSPYHIIYQLLVQGKFNLVLSFEILLEYQEVLQQKYNVPTANALVALLKELPNVHFYTPFYNWMLINVDPDDNKYTDCAIAGSANFIVTEDKHFGILKTIPFPKIIVLSIDEFNQLLAEKE